MVVELRSCSWIGRWPQSLCFVRRCRLVEAATDSWRNAGGECAPKGVARGLFCRSFMVCSELCFLGRCMLLACCLWAEVRLCSGDSCSAFRTIGNVFSVSKQCCCYYCIVAEHLLTSSSNNRYHVLFDSWVFIRLWKLRFERFVSSSFSFLSFQQVPCGYWVFVYSWTAPKCPGKVRKLLEAVVINRWYWSKQESNGTTATLGESCMSAVQELTPLALSLTFVGLCLASDESPRIVHQQQQSFFPATFSYGHSPELYQFESKLSSLRNWEWDVI
jgi:hypothetical protein